MTLHQLWQNTLSEGAELEQDFSNLKKMIGSDLSGFLGSPAVIHEVFAFLREFEPIFVAKGLAIVSRYDDVLEVLSRGDAFSVVEVYAAKMDESTGPFILGMSDTSEYQNDLAIMQSAVHPEDIQRIQTIVDETARQLVEEGVREGCLDVVAGLSRLVPTRLVGSYFGTPGPDDQTTMQWMRAIFQDVFLNLSNDPAMHAEAVTAAKAVIAYIDDLIPARKAQIIANPDAFDDYLSRLIKYELANPGSIDDVSVQRFVCGLIIGTVDTNSKAITQILDFLLNHPDLLRAAQRAAQADDPIFSNYAFEALRFNPQTPLIIRHCENNTVVAQGTPRERTISGGSTVYVGTWSAMFDSLKVEDPEDFKVNRPDDVYLHFGYGQHTCFGRYFAHAIIPGVLKALLKVPHIERADGTAGQIQSSGAFPDHLVLKLGK